MKTILIAILALMLCIMPAMGTVPSIEQTSSGYTIHISQTTSPIKFTIYFENFDKVTAQTTRVYESAPEGLGNHWYNVGSGFGDGSFSVYISKLPGMVQLYHVRSPFDENYDNVFIASEKGFKDLIATRCWIGVAEVPIYVYPTQMKNTRPLYQFSARLSPGIGDHVYSTSENWAKSHPYREYDYDGIVGFVPT
jgi:hypothetical protein